MRVDAPAHVKKYLQRTTTAGEGEGEGGGVHGSRRPSARARVRVCERERVGAQSAGSGAKVPLCTRTGVRGAGRGGVCTQQTAHLPVDAHTGQTQGTCMRTHQHPARARSRIRPHACMRACIHVHAPQ
jgi:hypothetical protein